MGKKTDYKRLWKREQEVTKKLYREIEKLRQANEGLVDVLTRIKKGEIEMEKIFEDEKIPNEVKLKEAIKQKKP